MSYPLGAWYDFVLAPFGAAGAISSALPRECPTGATVAELDAKADDVEKNWNPTGYYTAAQMRDIVGATMNMVNQYHNTVQATRTEYTTAMLAAAEEVFNEVGRQAVDYTSAWRKAQETDTAVNAPGLKKWVLFAMRASQRGMRAVELASCDKPWWFGALATYTAMFSALVGVVKRIAGVIVKLGQAVIDAAETGIKLWPIFKWGLIGFGLLYVAIYAFTKLEGARESGQRPIDWSCLNPIARMRERARGTVQGNRRRQLAGSKRRRR